MSWLSEALQKVGVSKDAQRAVVKAGGVVLAPATGGLSLIAGAAATAVKAHANVSTAITAAAESVTQRAEAAQDAFNAAGTVQPGLSTTTLLLGAGAALLLLKAGD